jgi:hypothetical protein
MNQPPRKWIQKEIEQLDAEKDYVRIWRLTNSYGLNDFMQNLIYALTFPNFVVTDWGSKAIWREDGGKTLGRATHRVEQTGSANALWWFYGPEDQRTRDSVDSINRLHAHWAKSYPGAFSYNDDYIYVCAFTAITMHRLRLQMGLPGISEKEKVAAHIFWREMSKLFVSEGGIPLHGYPENFDALIAFCEAFENSEKPKPERGNLVTAAIHEQFVFRFFPKEIHWLGHQLVRSLSLPTTLDTMQIDQPYPLAKEILPKLIGLVFWHQEVFGDDPEESYIEARDQLPPEDKAKIRAEIRELDNAFPAHFAETYKDDPKFIGCPYHAMLNQATRALAPLASAEIHALEVRAGVIEAR